MTPIALWTGRLPKLRPLLADGWLGVVGLLAAFAGAGSVGLVQLNGLAMGCAANAALCLLLLKHRWPRHLPRGLRPTAAPHGPDERAVTVELRRHGALIGWDVGILWFERGGFGFVGDTTTFILPRSMIQPEADASFLGLHAPHLLLPFEDVQVRIVPLGAELMAQTTVARIERLPEEATPDIVLPPNGLHPDLIARATATRRRVPYLWSLLLLASVASLPPQLASLLSPGPLDLTLTVLNTVACLLLVSFGGLVPRVVRDALPTR
jgi:hypothetical protein